MFHFVVIEDAVGRRYHYPIDPSLPISQLFESLSDSFGADFSLAYKGRAVTRDETFGEIGYERFSAIQVSSRIDLVASDRPSQLSYLASVSINDPIASEVLEEAKGDLRLAVSLAHIRSVSPENFGVARTISGDLGFDLELLPWPGASLGSRDGPGWAEVDLDTSLDELFF
jgi:hypothetical protein